MPTAIKRINKSREKMLAILYVIALRTEEKNKQKAPKNRCFNFILGSLKSQNFDVFKPH